MQNRRRPWLAALLTLLWPGLGHLYCGKALRAAAYYVVSLILLMLGVWTFVSLDSRPINWLLPVIAWPLWWIWLVVSAIRTARQQGGDFSRRIYNRWYVYVIAWLVAAFVWGQIFPYVGHQAFKFPSKSMEAALFEGDYIFADMKAYSDSDPEVNDVIVFLFPQDRTTKYIKRCAAGSGDTVQIRDKFLWVNGVIIDEPKTVQFVKPEIQPRSPEGADSPDNFGPFIVPADHYFMLGDNRDNSYDSRWFGPVPRDLILGRAVRIYWSHDLDRIGMRVQ